ncbi:three-helix bundle dimerization domain-containing protein [Streptomyces xanthophaeus]|uniref:three-helix bundle dimerization domain-containing protein n=1 Tax=Streptomyces xanthophaeus TaxID=67385 RepID=UPI0037243B6B
MKETEDAVIVRHVPERLSKTRPGLGKEAVDGAVQTAYDELRYARVRTYLTVLLERRAGDLLGKGPHSRP